MCEYCESNWENKKYITEKNRYGKGADCYIGIDTYIDGNMLGIDAVGEVGYPSKDSTVVEEEVKINYCPMCGRKLGE